VAVLLAFSAWRPAGIASYPGLVDWPTIATLSGLLLLTAGIECSGFLHRLALRITHLIHDERRLAQFLTLSSALLAALLTNDIALFIVVPLTLSLGQLAVLPLKRLVIFETLAVNTGSMLSPIGNPQNIFLWQSSGSHFHEFIWRMGPPTLIATCCLGAFTFMAFSSRPLQMEATHTSIEVRWRLFAVSALCFVPFIVAADLRHADLALLAAAVLFLALFRQVFRHLDWPLLVVFVLMFVDLRLVAGLPWVRQLLLGLDLHRPLTLYCTGALLSQFISNVPTTILLSGYSSDWQSLAWGADVGGFGLAIGSLASLIALRLGRQPGALRAFHAWSLPFFLVAGCITGLWLWLTTGG
jgi:Na+/H+ antiporter NhaD/arsenite permease-like protein